MPSDVASDLAPSFLVAAPSLLDPNFRRSVVLLVDHREEGSLGFIINRTGDVELDDVVQALDVEGLDASRTTTQVVVGGPIEPETGWIVFELSADKGVGVSDELIRMSGDLCVSASRELLIQLLKNGHERLLVALGYAGWGPGQLDEEIAQGAWIPVDLSEEIVFETAHEARWTAALKTLGIDPARLSTVSPSAAS